MLICDTQQTIKLHCGTKPSSINGLSPARGAVLVWIKACHKMAQLFLYSVLQRTCNIAIMLTFKRVRNRDRTTKVRVAAHPNIIPNSFSGAHGNICDNLSKLATSSLYYVWYMFVTINTISEIKHILSARPTTKAFTELEQSSIL